jgi:hypothetical protein
MRRDEPDGSDTPGDPAPDPGVASVTDPIAADPELTPGPVQSDADRDVQEENAETSLDQPST